MDDKTLEQLAVQELLTDAKRGKERYKTMGPRGWQKNLIPRANKHFLQRTLASSLHASNRQKRVLQKHKIDEKSNEERCKVAKVDSRSGCVSTSYDSDKLKKAKSKKQSTKQKTSDKTVTSTNDDSKNSNKIVS